MGTTAGSVPPLYSSYHAGLHIVYTFQRTAKFGLQPGMSWCARYCPPSRPLQPEEMWGVSRHLRLETKPNCELSQDDFQILVFNFGQPE